MKVWDRQMKLLKNSEHQRYQLNLLMRSLVLRRTKDQRDKAGKQLVDLPEKRLIEHRVPLRENELKYYEQLMVLAQYAFFTSYTSTAYLHIYYMYYLRSTRHTYLPKL